MDVLAVDAGNTRIKWAWRRGAAAPWTEHGAVATDGPLDPLAAAAASAAEVWLCDVGPKARAARLGAALGQAPSLRPIAAAAAAGGVRSGYARPELLGADRWCALLGLRALLGAAAGTVALAGTALTIDCLAADGRHLGGLILPGRRALLEALTAHTPLRLDAELFTRPAAELDDTAAAVRAGIGAAAAGAIKEHAAAQGLAEAPVVLAGGDAPWLAALLPAARLEPDIVFAGMAAAVN
ncbi:MAG: type III pantothenate kinase [Betaproteobacteria bacterium AqS2]|uniref:Type III pantothenate kinase n=1 Tax=Candidatus Amphirhobacter heronislandensis TaxID=1732024 RepID=A0A930Y1Y2_9GAMM|nr:type III pantothenate kinase [Betaproteobacteria bacterium AqS2]